MYLVLTINSKNGKKQVERDAILCLFCSMTITNSMSKKLTDTATQFEGDHIEVIRFVLQSMDDKEIKSINLKRHDNNWIVEMETSPRDKGRTQVQAGIFDMGW